MRTEEEIFVDLTTVCRSPGYIHAIAHLCFTNTFAGYTEVLTAKDLEPLYSRFRLIRTELSMLIGLLVQEEISYSIPDPDVFQTYLDRTDALLKEMHDALSSLAYPNLEPEILSEPNFQTFTQGKDFREMMFYGSESAFNFQYRDFAPQKYMEDDQWLIANKGFSIGEAREVVQAIEKIRDKKVNSTRQGFHHIPPEDFTFLPDFTFHVAEVAGITGVSESTTENVLDAFALPVRERNRGFRSPQDFNATNATPLLRKSTNEYILFQQYSLDESLYQSPFYWLGADKEYAAAAAENRGKFTEVFCRERLELVFGESNVYPNVRIVESKRRIRGEIDVLVVFGNRAIVVQAKSKQLTLESRKGNDRQLRDDFKKSVQDSYDQGFLCAESLNNPRFSLVEADGQELAFPYEPKEIYILCVVADHYPALYFHVRQFLRFKKTDLIPQPLILDVFALDAITEMLQSPLYFLSYVHRRVNYSDKILASHEMTILSYHLKQNLWLNDELDILCIGDDFGAHLAIAMTVRREGLEGRETPEGILTQFQNTALNRIVQQIEAIPEPAAIDLGYLLLTLGEKVFLNLGKLIERICKLARQDGQNHDFTISLRPADAGITVHSNWDPDEVALPLLQRHAEQRKCHQRANRWFAICIDPSTLSFRFILSLDFQWQRSEGLDSHIQHLPAPVNLSEALGSNLGRLKAGRNSLCPCGSGNKFKRCCLGKKTV